MTQPQIIVTLGPQGNLVAELPGLNGTRRQVDLRHKSTKGFDASRRPDESTADYISRLKDIISDLASESTIEATLTRILQSQLSSRVAIGEDGAPTSQQVRHWERHQDIWGDPQCPFCIAEGRFQAPVKKRQQSTSPRQSRVGDGSVTVRRAKTNKMLIPDPAGGLLPIMVTRAEARRAGYKFQPKPQTSTSTSLEELGL